jgi:hypothetical protein
LSAADKAKGISTIDEKLEQDCCYFSRLDKLFGGRQNITPTCSMQPGKFVGIESDDTDDDESDDDADDDDDEGNDLDDKVEQNDSENAIYTTNIAVNDTESINYFRSYMIDNEIVNELEIADNKSVASNESDTRPLKEIIARVREPSPITTTGSSTHTTTSSKKVTSALKKKKRPSVNEQIPEEIRTQCSNSVMEIANGNAVKISLQKKAKTDWSQVYRSGQSDRLKFEMEKYEADKLFRQQQFQQETKKLQQETKTSITIAMINGGKSLDEIEETLLRLFPNGL